MDGKLQKKKMLWLFCVSRPLRCQQRLPEHKRVIYNYLRKKNSSFKTFASAHLYNERIKRYAGLRSAL